MRVIALLRSMHRHVFVDCGHVLEAAVKEALDCSDHVIVVATLSLPAIRRTKRLLEALRTAQYPSNKVSVVINRYIDEQKELLTQTQSMLGIEMAGLIPNDYGTASEAINHGKPLTIMASRTSIGQWYLRGTEQLICDKTLESRMASAEGQEKNASFLGRCFASFGFDARRKAPVV
jgi:pilus assembly protein CpaE